VERIQIILLNTRRKLIRVEQLLPRQQDTCWCIRARYSAPPSWPMLPPSCWPTIIPAATHASEADIKVTRDLIRAGQLLKIEVLDHVILGQATQERPKDFLSLRSWVILPGSEARDEQLLRASAAVQSAEVGEDQVRQSIAVAAFEHAERRHVKLADFSPSSESLHLEPFLGDGIVRVGVEPRADGTRLGRNFFRSPMPGLAPAGILGAASWARPDN